jgi:hypothetical protein
MDFKLISKNNIGGAIFLLLIIALSQAKAFNFLMDTALGRIFLIIFILSLSHCHKILGVVGVLLIVIMFNSNMYYEGFENKNTTTDASSNSVDISSNSVDPSSNSTTTLNADQIKQMIQQQISAAASNKNSSSSSDSTTDSSSSTTTVTKKPNNSTGAEGFDILGIENNIKRGKQSNSIPVNNFMRDADSIMPYDGTSFLGSFSPF